MATVGFTPFAAVHPAIFLASACALLFAASLAKPGTPGSLSSQSSATVGRGWNLRKPPNTIGVAPGWYLGDDGRPYYWKGN